GYGQSLVDGAEQIAQVEPLGHHGEVAGRRARPLLLWAVPVEFDAIVVRIAKIKRLADAVVARAVEWDVGLDQPAQRVGERRTRGIENRAVIEPGGAGRRRRAAAALPGVEPDVMVI